MAARRSSSPPRGTTRRRRPRSAGSLPARRPAPTATSPIASTPSATAWPRASSASTVVFGSENGLKAAIDASKGSSLAESDALKSARSTVRQERSGFLYADVASLLRQALAGAGGGAAQLAPLVGPISQALPKTVAAALDAEPGMLRIDSAAIGNGGGVRPAGSGADALAALPGDAWLGLGVGELGKTVDDVIARLSSGGGLAGVGVQALLAQAQQQIGLDIRRDLLAWMGDAGLFVSGDADEPRRRARRRLEGPGRVAEDRSRPGDARAPQRRRVLPDGERRRRRLHA